MTVLAFAGCKDEESTEPAPAPVETQAPVPTTEVVPDKPEPAAGITPRIRAEVDNRDPDAAHKGKTLATAGAKGAFTVPAAWTNSAAGGWSMSKAADGKSGLASTKFTSTDDAVAKATEGAQGLGFTDCKWAAAESVSAGKDKLAGTAADGSCKHAGADAPVAFVALPGDDAAVIAVGAWAAGADATPVFASFRSVKKGATGTGDASGIAACCAALRGNAASAPLQQKGLYLTAAGACDAVRKSPQGRAALGTVRAMLAGASVPASCR